MLKRVAGVSIALLLTAANAVAGDVYWAGGGRAKDYELYAYLHPWTGFYFGGNGGYGWKGDRASIVTSNNSSSITTPDPSSKGAFGGGQMGYNWQHGRWIWGVVTDLQLSGVTGSTAGTVSGTTYRNQQDLDYFGTLRARLGYSASNAMIYVTGGFAYGSVTDKISQTAGSSLNFSKSFFETGYAVGGGVEYWATASWSFSAEYLRIDLGHDGLAGYNNCVCAVYYYSNQIKNSFDTIKLTANYHLNHNTVAMPSEPPYK